MTLVETVVAMTIMAVVVTVVYQTFANAMSVYRRYERAQWYEQNVRMCWSVMGRDFRCAYASSSDNHVQCVGNKDSVGFVTMGDGTHPELGGMEAVEYRIDPARGLVKTIRCYLSDSAAAPPIEQQIAPMACALHLRYFDGKIWQDEWGTASSGIPPDQKYQVPFFVEIAVTLRSSGAANNEETITTRVPVITRTLSQPAL
jgi:type II secretory pathway pseudopilin PulG